MAVKEFLYSPLPGEREASNNLQLQRNSLTKWVEHTVNNFGTKNMNFDDRENWAVILSSFKTTWVIVIIMIVSLLLGIVYLSLRLLGYLRPLKDYTEKSCQKLIRWILTILMLILIATILYFLITSIRTSLALSRMKVQSAKKQSDIGISRKLDHILINNYEEFKNKTEGNVNDLADNSLRTINADKAAELACSPADNVGNINGTIEKMNKELDVLCLDVLVWSDYMRFFYRNMSKNLMKMASGEKLLTKFEFANFLSRTLHMDTLMNFRNILGFVERFFNSFSQLYKMATPLSDELENKIRNVLSGYVTGIQDDLKQKGNIYRSLSTELWQERFTYNQNQIRKNSLSKKPVWVYVCEWISYVFLLLIMFILLIAFLFRCCGKRYRHEAKCWNHENASILFQTAAVLILIFFIIVLLPFLWHFVHGVGFYNGVCKKLGANREKRSINSNTSGVGTNWNDNCLNKYSLKNLLKAEDIRPNLTPMASKDLELVGDGSINLSKYATDFKKNAEDVKNLNLNNLCDSIKSDMHAKYFNKMYREMLQLLNDDKANNHTSMKELLICNLEAFKIHRMDKFEMNTIFKSANQLANDCTNVVNFFDQSYMEITTKCIEGLRKKDSIGNKINLTGTVDGLNKMYADELTKYLDMVSDALINNVGLCRLDADRPDDQMRCYGIAQPINTIWSALMILIWLIPPLIPISLYLSRLYGTSIPRPFKKSSYVNGKTRDRKQWDYKRQRSIRDADMSQKSTMQKAMQRQLFKKIYRQYAAGRNEVNGQTICGQSQRQANANKSCYDNSVLQECKEEVQDNHKPSTSKGVCYSRKECADKSASPENITVKCYSQIVGEIRCTSLPDKVKITVETQEAKAKAKSMPNKVKTTADSQEAPISRGLCLVRAEVKNMPGLHKEEVQDAHKASTSKGVCHARRECVDKTRGQYSMNTEPREKSTNECDNKRFEETNIVAHTEPFCCEEKVTTRGRKCQTGIKDTIYEPSTSARQPAIYRHLKNSVEKKIVEERKECKERVIKTTTTSLHVKKTVKNDCYK